MKNPRIELYLNAATDYSITDHHGEVLTLEQAKEVWQSGKVSDWNMAFGRLAMNFNFDLEQTKQYYAEERKKWEKGTRVAQ